MTKPIEGLSPADQLILKAALEPLFAEQLEAIVAPYTDAIASAVAGVAAEVATRKALIDQGVAQTGDALSVQSSINMVLMRLLETGVLYSPAFDLGSGRQISVRDPMGMQPWSVDDQGRLRTGGMIFGSDPDGHFTISDALGQLLLRGDGNELRVLGQPVGPRNCYLPAGPFMPRWQYARAGVVQGERPARLVLLGDSNTGGTYSGGVGVTLREQSAASVLGRLLDRALAPTSYASFWGSFGQPSPAAYAYYWPVVVPSAGWTFSAEASLGEMFVSSTPGATLPLDYGREWDRGEVMVAPAVPCTIELSCAGVAQSFSPAVGALSTLTLDLPATSLDPLVAKVISGTTRICGGMTLNRSRPEINVMNVSRSGWRASHWAHNASWFSPRSAIKALQADVVGIELGLNEWNGGETPASHAANMQILIDELRGTGADVFIVSSLAPDGLPDYQGGGRWEEYVAQHRRLARFNGIPHLDMTARCGAGAEVTVNGQRADKAHPDRYGYGEKGLALLSFLMN